jgi:hypothetical protein
MFKDFSDWVIYEGFHEGSGRSEKIWLKNLATNQIGLFKFKKDLNTKDHISEKLASELAALLGIPCAHVEIGIYNGREGSMSFLINKDDEALIEGIWLINQLYPNYSAEKMYDESTEEYYSLEMIVNSVEKYGLLPELLKMLVFDYLIGNSDRHQNNWAIISKGDKTYTFSPLYDNSSSLCCYVPEDKIASLLGNDKNRWNALVKTKSRSIVRLDKKNKKTPTHEEVLKYICDNDRYFKYVYELLVEICKKITVENLDSLFAKYPIEILSEQRKELIKRFLIDKVGIIREILNRKEA